VQKLYLCRGFVCISPFRLTGGSPSITSVSTNALNQSPQAADDYTCPFFSAAGACTSAMEPTTRRVTVAHAVACEFAFLFQRLDALGTAARSAEAVANPTRSAAHGQRYARAAPARMVAEASVRRERRDGSMGPF
jgi:hypothetical protein